MLMLGLAMWPIYISGIQILTANWQVRKNRILQGPEWRDQILASGGVSLHYCLRFLFPNDIVAPRIFSRNCGQQSKSRFNLRFSRIDVALGLDHRPPLGDVSILAAICRARRPQDWRNLAT